MKFSVVIPAHNKAEILKLSLPSVFEQTLSGKNYEVIVIDDGSTDNTPQLLREFKRKYDFRSVRLEDKGPAAARNRGLQESRGASVLFLQDDIIAGKSLLERHYKFHQQHSGEEFALVGYVTWAPNLKITPFMYWLEHGGPQFDYDRLKGRTADKKGLIETDHLTFYTPNLSLKKSFLEKKGGFDEEFYVKGGTAYEDLELGWRLRKAGLRLFYDSRALAYHHHPKNLKTVCRRRFLEGRMSHLLYHKHPDLKLTGDKESLRHQITHLKTGFLPDTIRFRLTHWIFNRFTVWPLEKLACFLENRANWPILYKIVCGYWYNRGYASLNANQNS